MRLDDFGFMVFMAGLAITAFGTTVYGVITGDIVSLGGEGRGTELIWSSRADEPQRFWVSVVVHLVVGVFSAYMVRHSARGKP